MYESWYTPHTIMSTTINLHSMTIAVEVQAFSSNNYENGVFVLQQSIQCLYTIGMACTIIVL